MNQTCNKNDDNVHVLWETIVHAVMLIVKFKIVWFEHQLFSINTGKTFIKISIVLFKLSDAKDCKIR